MCHRFSRQNILEVKVFSFAGPQPFPQGDQALFSLFPNVYIQ